MEKEDNSNQSKKDDLIINEGILKDSQIFQLPPPSILIPSKSICKIETPKNMISSGFLIKFFKGEKDFKDVFKKFLNFFRIFFN